MWRLGEPEGDQFYSSMIGAQAVADGPPASRAPHTPCGPRPRRSRRRCRGRRRSPAVTAFHCQISSQGAANDCALSLIWSGRAAENAGLLKRQHRSRSQRRFPEDVLVANVGCRRGAGIRPATADRRLRTPQADFRRNHPVATAMLSLPVGWRICSEPRLPQPDLRDRWPRGEHPPLC